MTEAAGSRLSEANGPVPRQGGVGRVPSGRLPDARRGGRGSAGDGPAGVDVVEVGLPYSDPLMDGPTIQRAVDAALRGGTMDVLPDGRGGGVGRNARGRDVVLEPDRPLWTRSLRPRARGCRRIRRRHPGPDPRRGRGWLPPARGHRLDTVFLVAPSSTDERIALTVEACRGFVYAASTMGVTGARAQVVMRRPGGARPAATTLPIAVGLGVSTRDQAAEVACFADGVVVGSAFVRRLLDAGDEASGVSAVAQLAGELAGGVRQARNRLAGR